MVAEIGVKVKVLEKRTATGGNTIIAGGRMNVTRTRQQARLSIDDFVECHFKETWAAGDYADPELVWTLVRGAKDAAAFLEKHGMKFREDEVSAGIGGLWSRGIIPIDSRGTGYIKVWKQAAEKLGVEILLETKMTEIIRENTLSGRILGVKAIDEEGKEIVFKAKSVIIATGGFVGDADFKIKYDHRWTEDFHDRNYPGQTAEGLVIAADIGAESVH